MLNEAGCLAETDRGVPSYSDVGQSLFGQSVPQYSTVTALVLRYSMSASSPEDETKNKPVSVKQYSLVKAFTVTEERHSAEEQMGVR